MIENGSGAAVDLNTSLASYTLSIDLGNRSSTITSSDVQLELVAGATISGGALTGGTVVGTGTFNEFNAPAGGWANFSFTISGATLSADSLLNGKGLSIEIMDLGGSGGGTHAEFTDVQLTESAAWVGGASGDVNNWSNVNNWSVPATYSNSNAFTPTIGAAAGAGSGVTNIGINLTQATTSGTLTFGATSQSFTVGSTGGYALTVDINNSANAVNDSTTTAASTVALVNNGTSGTTQTISAALNVINSSTGTLAPIIDNAGNGSLTLSGGLSVDAQGSTATGATSGGFYLENDGTGTISVNGGAYYQASSSTTLNFTGAGAGVINFSPTSATNLGTINVATDSTVNFGTSFTATTVNLGNSTGVAGATAGAATVYLTGAGITLTSAIAESPSASGTLTFGSNDTAATSGSAVTNTLTGNWVTSTTAHTDVLSAAQYNTLDINGDISGGASILVTGTGTVLLSQANTYAQKTTINGGTLDAAGTGSVTTAGSGSLNNTAGVTVNNGGTLLFGANDVINHTATLATLGSGTGTATIAFATSVSHATETMGALTLNSGTTIIDFGSGDVGNTLKFSSLTLSGTAVVDVYDWNGPDYDIGGTDSGSLSDSQDRLLFSSLTGITQPELSQISFYSGDGTGFIGTGAEIAFPNGGSYQDEVAVPEPSTVFAGVCLLGLIGWRSRRRLQELVGGSTVTWQPS